MKNSALISLAMPVLLTACVATPPTTPQTEQLVPQTLGLSTQAAPGLTADWWTVFNDPQIDQMANLVMSGNPTLGSAMARIRAASADAAAASAADYPQFSLDAIEQRELFSSNYIIPPPFGGSYRWFGQTLGNLTWTLDFWGKQAVLIAKARHTQHSAELDAAAARLALSGAFAQAYINLLLAYENGDIADKTLAERQDILRLTQDRYDSGLENAAALEQAKALMSLARIDQMRFAAARDTGIHALAALTGQGAGSYADIKRPIVSLDAALSLPDFLPADLLARRPDVLAARARIEAATAGRKAVHAEFYPNINLAAFVGFQAIGLSHLFTADSLTYGAGPAIHLPIFDAGKIRAQYAGATAALDAAVNDYNGAVLTAIRQTADALTQTESLSRQRPEQQNALDSAARAFALAESRYQAGLSDQLPMLNAEATLQQSRQQMVALVANAAIQRVTLLLSLGGGFAPADNKTDESKTVSVSDTERKSK